MPTPYSTQQIIDIAKVSQALAANDAERSGFQEGRVSKDLAAILYTERKSVEFTNTNDSGNVTDLEQTARYLYDLCGKYALEAASLIIDTGLSNPSTTAPRPDPIEFEVSASTPIATGGSTLTIEEFIGYNLLFARNEHTESQVNRGGTYFTWNKITGEFVCYGAATLGELFQLYPI